MTEGPRLSRRVEEARGAREAGEVAVAEARREVHLGQYPIVTSPCSAATSYQVSYHIQ